MATEDTTEQTDETTDPTQAETAAGGTTDVETPPEKSVEELRAELEQARKQLKETNRKAASDRARIAEIDREKQEKEDSKLSETARLKKLGQEAEARARAAEDRAEKAEAEALNRRIDQEIERAAIGLFEYPQTASKLIDRNRIEYDQDADKVTGIKEALERVLKEFPGMAAARRGGGSPAAMKVRRPGAGNGVDGAPGLVEQFVMSGGYEPM